jgi:hypothetical protein
MFNKSPKISFYNVKDGIADQMPIIPSGAVVHEWKKRAASDFKSKVKKCPITGLTTASKCPAINNIQTNGWVVRLDQDVTIHSNSTGDIIQWSTSRGNDEYISLHPKEAFHKYRNNWPEWSAEQIIKFNLGWYVDIPKGYSLLQIPTALTDENTFTAVEGMYNSDLGPAGLSVPVYWHALDRTTTIKAGTPLVQFILVKNESVDFHVSDITESFKQKIAINDKFFTQSFYRNYNNIKNYWKSKF